MGRRIHDNRGDPGSNDGGARGDAGGQPLEGVRPVEPSVPVPVVPVGEPPIVLAPPAIPIPPARTLEQWGGGSGEIVLATGGNTKGASPAVPGDKLGGVTGRGQQTEGIVVASLADGGPAKSVGLGKGWWNPVKLWGLFTSYFGGGGGSLGAAGAGNPYASPSVDAGEDPKWAEERANVHAMSCKQAQYLVDGAVALLTQAKKVDGSVGRGRHAILGPKDEDGYQIESFIRAVDEGAHTKGNTTIIEIPDSRERIEDRSEIKNSTMVYFRRDPPKEVEGKRVPISEIIIIKKENGYHSFPHMSFKVKQLQRDNAGQVEIRYVIESSYLYLPSKTEFGVALKQVNETTGEREYERHTDPERLRRGFHFPHEHFAIAVNPELASSSPQSSGDFTDRPQDIKNAITDNNAMCNLRVLLLSVADKLEKN